MFSPVVKNVTVRMVIALIKYLSWPAGQFDVVTTSLGGILKEVVKCVAPEEVELDQDFDCLELVEAIYGLKQASRVWNDTSAEFLCLIGFQVSAFDPCFYMNFIEGYFACYC